MTIDSAAATSAGRVRPTNEDAVMYDDRLFVVADGMGGHAAGEFASRIAVDQMTRLSERGPISTEDVVVALDGANHAIVTDADAHPERQGMGTTIVGLVSTEFAGHPHWLGFSVGDSRIYEISTAGLRQLSVDHSEVQEMVEAGEISVAEARRHPRRHVVTRSLGTLPAPLADVWIFPMEPGRTFLLCSDGLTDELDDEAIGRLVDSETDLDRLADDLVRTAEEAGGKDNISVVLVRTALDDEYDDSDDDTTPRAGTTA